MKYTNLSDLLKGICDAIRDKKGTTGAIKHQDIPSEIASIKTQSQDVLSLASGITSYTESFTIDGEERPNVLDGPSDFSNEDKVIWGTVEATTKHYTHSIQNIDGAENGVAAVITSTSVKNSNYSNVFWFNTTVDSSTSNNKTYLLAIRAKASRQITSNWPMYMYYYYPIGSTTSSWHGAFSFKPTTEWKIFYAIVNIPNDKYMYDNTISFCNHGDGTTYYIDWMAAYDITGLNFDHMTFGANATVYSPDVVKGKSFYKDGVLYTGSMVSYTKEETTKSLGRTTTSYTIPAGKHSGSGTVSLNIDSTYNYATPQKDTKTYYPGGTSPTDQVFTSFRVQGDSNLVASNIKSGVSIFGVTGTLSGGDGGWGVPLVSPCDSYYKLTFNRQDDGTKRVSGVMIFCLSSYAHTDGEPETLISYFYNPAGIYGTGTSSMEGATHFLGFLRDATSSGNSRYYRDYYKDSDTDDYKPTLAISPSQIVLSFDSSISNQYEMANGKYYCCIPIFGQGETENTVDVEVIP